MFAKTLSSRFANKKNFLILPLRSHLPRSISTRFNAFQPNYSTKFLQLGTQPKFVNNAQLLLHLSNKPVFAMNIKRFYSTENNEGKEKANNEQQQQQQQQQAERQKTTANNKEETAQKVGGFFSHKMYSPQESEEIRKVVQQFEDYYRIKKTFGFTYKGKKVGFPRMLTIVIILFLFAVFCHMKDMSEIDQFGEAAVRFREAIPIYEQGITALITFGRLPEDYKETKFGFGETVYTDFLVRPPQEAKYKIFETAFNLMSSFGIAFFYSTLVAKWHIKRYLKKFPEQVPNFSENIKNFIVLRRSSICSITVLSMTAFVLLFSSLVQKTPDPDFLYSYLNYGTYWDILPHKEFPRFLRGYGKFASERYLMNSRVILREDIQERVFQHLREDRVAQIYQNILQFIALLFGLKYSLTVFFPFVFSKEISRLIAQQEKNLRITLENKFYMLQGDERVHINVGIDSGIVHDPSLFIETDEYHTYQTALKFPVQLNRREGDFGAHRMKEKQWQFSTDELQRQLQEYEAKKKKRMDAKGDGLVPIDHEAVAEAKAQAYRRYREKVESGTLETDHTGKFDIEEVDFAFAHTIIAKNEKGEENDVYSKEKEVFDQLANPEAFKYLEKFREPSYKASGTSKEEDFSDLKSVIGQAVEYAYGDGAIPVDD